jgi:cyclopropane fatty-acyl-phospholipid synthase-like methyltransferase
MKREMKQEIHPWELAWRSGRWKEVSPPLPAVEEFCGYLSQNGLKRVLDLGAGGGRHTLLMAGRGFQVVALDVSETALEALDRRVREAGVQNVALVRHEMSSLPFVDGYFDGVVSTNVMHHGKSREVKAAMEEVRRIMRKGGAALFVVVSDRDFRFGDGKKLEPKTYVFTHGEEKGIVHHFFSVGELRTLMNGFRVVRIWERFHVVADGRRAHIYAIVRKR